MQGSVEDRSVVLLIFANSEVVDFSAWRARLRILVQPCCFSRLCFTFRAWDRRCVEKNTYFFRKRLESKKSVYHLVKRG